MGLNDINSLSHTRWNCKYHIVFAPKYRRKVFYKEKKAAIGKILRQLCERKGGHGSGSAPQPHPLYQFVCGRQATVPIPYYAVHASARNKGLCPYSNNHQLCWRLCSLRWTVSSSQGNKIRGDSLEKPGRNDMFSAVYSLRSDAKN